jgi:hypothetical protein
MCIVHETRKRDRYRYRDVLGREKCVLRSKNDNYLRIKFES